MATIRIELPDTPGVRAILSRLAGLLRAGSGTMKRDADLAQVANAFDVATGTMLAVRVVNHPVTVVTSEALAVDEAAFVSGGRVLGRITGLKSG